MKNIFVIALIASTSAIHLNRMAVSELSMTSEDHPCDLLEESGEDIDTSLAV